MSPPLFPLARLEVEPAPRASMSRSIRQRASRRRHIVSRVNETIDSLSWLSHSPGSSSEKGWAVHAEVSTRLIELVEERVLGASTPSAEEAARRFSAAASATRAASRM